jgi:hypothetical protein
MLDQANATRVGVPGCNFTSSRESCLCVSKQLCGFEYSTRSLVYCKTARRGRREDVSKSSEQLREPLQEYDVCGSGEEFVCLLLIRPSSTFHTRRTRICNNDRARRT